MADWDEVKRLAADFQKAQLSSTLQKLSERNCIEIVQWLIEKKLIDVIYTCDGKEYITPQHLVQEILGELYVQGGRINLVELAKNLNVDLAHINNNVPEVLKNNRNIHLILGQLIDDTYVTRIAGEINEKLSQAGQISVNDLTLQYDLPSEFLQHNVIEKQLGKLIQGRQDSSDPKIFFTEAFIARSKAKIRGALVGISRPTPVTAILNQIAVQDKLFFSLFDQCAKFGSLTSKLPGAQYIPHVYTRSQTEWVTNFYKQNGYLEFDALMRLGISDYKNYIKRQFSNEQIATLNSCIASQRILDQVEADIEECISSKSFLDLQANLPSVFNEEDFKILLDTILTPQRHKQIYVIDSFIISVAFIESLSKPCIELIEEKAKSVVDSGRYQQYQMDLQMTNIKSVPIDIKDDPIDVKSDKREERRRKAAGGKAGGGAQGRETKTKSTKKQTRKTQQNDSDDEMTVSVKKSVAILEIISLEEVKQLITPSLEEEGLDELIEPLAVHIQPAVNSKALEVAGNLYASTVTNQAANRRQTHTALQDRLNTLLGNVRLYRNGLKLLPADVQTQLNKYLIKTICTDIANEIISYLSSECNLGNINDSSLTNEQRNKLVNDLPMEHRPILQTLTKTLAGTNVDEFMTAAEESLSTCSMILKKIDKKKDRSVILGHKHALLETLEKCEDPALVLHLVTMIIFEIATQAMIHCSGRHVASLLGFLKQYLTEEQVNELANYHDQVTLFLGGGDDCQNIGETLKGKMDTIKKIAMEFKKPTSGEK